VRASVRGKVEGPGAALVLAVVALGPDNLLIEAARVRPAPDGSYTIPELAPGRYRIQLDAGGGRVLVVQPAFHPAVISADHEVLADFHVLRAL
jgi:hypothetical protein